MIKKSWWVPFLIAIFILALWLRIQPLRYNEMPDIDTYYFYRLDKYMLEHNLQLPEWDYLRNGLIGTDQHLREPQMPFYFPVYLYVLGGGWGLDFFHYALLLPAVLGALSIIVMFFLSREFGNNITGLFSAFFLSVITAYFTRTSGGEFEKEAFCCVFILLNIWLFIKAYKSKNWRYGLIYSLLSGINLFLTTQTWGGSAYYLFLLGTFSFILLLLNKNFNQVAIALTPMLVVPLVLNQFMAYNLYSLTSYQGLFASSLIILIAIRYVAERYNLIKKEQLTWLVPGLTVLGIVVILLSSMFFDPVYNMLNDALRTIGLIPSVELSTVAESQPGSWEAIVSMTSPGYAAMLLPILNIIIPYFSLWVYAMLGMLLIIYLFAKNVKNFDWLLLLPVIWFLSSIYGTLGYIRLGFVLGAPFALLSAMFISWLIERARRLKVMVEAKSLKQKINYVSIPLAIFLVLMIVVNIASAYVYSLALGPSHCFPNPQILIDGQRCLDTDKDGNIIRYAPGQPWYEAFEFMRLNMSKNLSVITWWDFGYWYHERAGVSTVSDGGFGNRYEIAKWYTADVSEWGNYTDWLIGKHKVGYIIQEYTLPGKYGAISTIAYQGKKTVGIMQFQRSAIYTKENKT
ncbi:MAG: STT3 domain-containing protein, partial [Candidatus Aenigmatarchaeota archaeon]